MKPSICVVGLGYVGLPLAVAFSNHTKVVGFDSDKDKIALLQEHKDPSQELSTDVLQKASLTYSANPKVIKEAEYIIIAVPTPVDATNKPDLQSLKAASVLAGEQLAKGATVVYESTVYPGVTEDICVPLLEEHSKLEYLKDFKVGYSPERINPGDKNHTLTAIVKVVAGCDKETTEKLAQLYALVVKAGIHKASSIKVAEAAKVIENIQRDINIALMNELQMIFDKLQIPFRDVLAAAGTKWNFHPFSPGLVGGHCIGVDPYYLAYEAQRQGHHPEIILAGRKINDGMASYEAQRVAEYCKKQNVKLEGLKLLVLGGTFKPNVSDLRNSKVQELITALKGYGCEVAICEPHVKAAKVHGCPNVALEKVKDYDFLLKAVLHTVFKDVKVDYELFKD